MDVRQKARVKWAIEGDKNSGFFHRTLNHNRRKNFIHGISINGIWISDPKTIQEEVAKFFSSKFNEPLSKRPLFQSNLFKKLSSAQKYFLGSDFTDIEIRMAVRDYEGDKAQGLDGFSFSFLKKFWNILGSSISNAVKDFCASASSSKV